MKITLIGASGFIGSHLLAEALERGHEVLAVTRRSQLALDHPRLKSRQLGQPSADAYARVMDGADAVISATRFLDLDPELLLAGLRMSSTRRLLLVGGAGSLLLPDRTRVVDSATFPLEYKDEALAGAAFLATLRRADDLDWSFLSPSADIFPGPKTGRFRLGDDMLLLDSQGKSSISAGDFAVAMIDEVERGQHVRARFTVGY